ncbi:class I SAM-dependent methyltransferase [Scytonema sp. NUACC26]|uniref:class I SAM-dependent methyltransferase n=1 Tax=Scytonema sp. NUACC26 TaxID=3140176 RepID=UPI0038B3188F
MTQPSPHASVQSATVSFDRVSNIYDSTRGLPSGVSEQITETILKIVSPTPDTKFFETGIGTGRIALPIIQKGYSYTGIDISEKMLDELRSKLQGINHRATLYAGDATNLPFSERSFDVAITVHVFHLIANWQKALAEVRRVLKPGGIYLYSHGRMNTATDITPAQLDFEEHWRNILASYGHQVTRFGATEDEVLATLREQGATLETVIPAKWRVDLTVGELLKCYENRIYSASWYIPEDIFPRAIQDLQEWTKQRFGSLDFDLSHEARSKFTVVRNWT